MKLIDILVIVALIIAISLFINITLYSNNTEHLTSLSNEAVQNLASAYNSGSLSVSNLQVTQSFNLLPNGIIVAWYYGTPPPTGWVVCDGTNGTPDLRSRFIVGSGQGAGLTNRVIGSYGGEENHQLTINELPSHNHQYPGDDQLQQWVDSTVSNINYDASSSGGNGHIYTTGKTGGNQPHNNMPPWYALMFIMKK